jgi:transcriptional regulator with XRE-family HTH domain
MAAHDTSGGRCLREFRQGLMLTQQDVAERLEQLAWVQHHRRVGVNADMVSKWERGKKRPSSFYLQLLCSLFGVSAAQLGFRHASQPVPPRPMRADSAMGATLELLDSLGGPVELLHAQVYSIWREGVLGRREILKAMGLVPAALGLDALSAPEGLVAAPSEPHFRGRESVADLEILAARLEAAYHVESPQQLLLPVDALSRTAERWLAGVREGGMRSGLLRVVGRSQLLLGRLAFFDRHRPMEARAHLDLAREAGVEASDALLAAAALGHMAFLPAEHHQFAAATSYIEGARSVLVREPLPEVAAWLSAVQAELDTNAEQFAPALACLDAARAQLSSASSVESPVWFDFFDEQRLGGFEGFTLRRSGDLSAARERLEGALGPGSNQGPKQRAVSMLDLGVVCVEQGDLDGGCRLATDAVLALRQADYATAVGRLEEFHAVVPDLGHPAAKLLTEALAELS